MKHAEKLADRILFLNGEPISRPAGEAVKGQEITDMLKTDISLEADAVGLYNEAAAGLRRRKGSGLEGPLRRASQGRGRASRHLREYEKPHRHAGRPLSGEPHGQVAREIRGKGEAVWGYPLAPKRRTITAFLDAPFLATTPHGCDARDTRRQQGDIPHSLFRSYLHCFSGRTVSCDHSARL